MHRVALIASLCLAGCGHTFTAQTSIDVAVQPAAGIVTIVADGLEACRVQGPAPYPMAVVCPPGEVAWYRRTASGAVIVTCAANPCPPGSAATYALPPDLRVICHGAD